MKQCCANCKWLKRAKSVFYPLCKFYANPVFKTIWWRAYDAPSYGIISPTRSGKTCKCWQEKR